MNDLLLIKAEKWFAELEIRTTARPTCLMVNEADLLQYGTPEVMLEDLRTVAGSRRLFWGERGIDKDNLYLHSI